MPCVPPAAIARIEPRLGMRVGTRTFAPPDIPSSLSVPSPQAYTFPSTPSAIVKEEPAATARASTGIDDFTGAVLLLVPPFPSLPAPPAPQHHTSPLAVSATECDPPAARAITFEMPV